MNNENTAIKNSRHAEFISASSRSMKKKEALNKGPFRAPLRSGFTLIELLVVVLIIGILAAVAVPQYQKAVEKSRASEALALFKSVVAATKVYYLANGDWPTSLDELDVEIPWTGNTSLRTGAQDTRSNEDWSMDLVKDTGEDTVKSVGISIGRISGPYKGTGFMYYNSYINSNRLDEIFCQEYVNSVTAPYADASTDGKYCRKIMGGTYNHYNGHAFVFSLPH